MPSQKKPGLTHLGTVPKPLCGAPTAAGPPCTGKKSIVKVKGKRYQLKTCVMHAPEAIKKELGVTSGAKFGSGRKKQLSPHAVLRQRIEADIDKYLKPLEDALTAMKAVVVGNGRSAHIQEVDDLALRIKAVNDILDRVYGRPKQITEVTGTDGAPMEVLVPNDDERRNALAAVLASTGALGAVIPANASASAPSTN